MSKYAELRDFLHRQNLSRLQMRFSEIEKVLGFSLPKSARLYPAWWANQDPPSSQSSSWTSAGWLTEVNIPSSKVTFVKVLGGTSAVKRTAQRDRSKTTPDIPVKIEEHETDSRGHFTEEIYSAESTFRWTQGGVLQKKDDGKLAHDIKSALPALYRIRLIGSGSERRYIGETVNISRRMYHYCRPGSSQATNIRLNEVFMQHLHYGGKIHVDRVQKGATVRLNGTSRAIDMTSKFDRRLLENAALLIELADGISLLNN